MIDAVQRPRAEDAHAQWYLERLTIALTTMSIAEQIRSLRQQRHYRWSWHHRRSGKVLPIPRIVAMYRWMVRGLTAIETSITTANTIAAKSITAKAITATRGMRAGLPSNPLLPLSVHGIQRRLRQPHQRDQHSIQHEIAGRYASASTTIAAFGP